MSSSASPRSLAASQKPTSTRYASPPKTPPNLDLSTLGRDSNSSSEDSPIEELSFDFTLDADGKYTRVPKSTHSSPPTLVDEDEPTDYEENKGEPPKQAVHKAPSPVSVDPPLERGTLSRSRSESLHHAERPSLPPNAPAILSRSVQCIATSANSSSTPAASSSTSTLRNTLPMNSGPPGRIDRPQRVTFEEFREQEERNRKHVEELKARMEDEVRRAKFEDRGDMLSDEEGAVSGRQRHLSLELPQLGSSRSLGGSLASSSGVRSSSTRAPRAMSSSAITNPASSRRPLDSAPAPASQRERDRERANSRPIMPGQNRAGRVLKSSASTKYAVGSTPASGWDYTSEGEGGDGGNGYGYEAYENQMVDRDWGGHKRRDSDTLRSAKSHPHLQQPSSPPTTPPPGEALPAHLSPSARTIINGPSLNALRHSHRRSPTVPELSHTGGSTGHPGAGFGKGKSWAGGEEREGPDEYGVNTAGTSGPSSARNARKQHQTQPVSGQHAILHPQQNIKNQLQVNKKTYVRLDVIGKGGSSRVFRVLNSSNEVFALKRVSLDKTDAETMNGYMNEIALLKRLEGNHRIIRLFDSELKPGAGGTRGYLLLVMEFGEIDMAKLLLEQQKEPMNMVWISYYWQQMLQAVHVIHEEKIVHSDLKPANFVLVRGQLKLIDFGIANAIANDTTNIQRDHQIGTLNYMSPEAIELPDGMRRLKVGRASDVWSLGCILYQMIYGQTPFHHLSVYQKMKAIPDSTHKVEFPEHATPSIPTSPQGTSAPPQKLDHLKRPVPKNVIQVMDSCLRRVPKERSTIPELMEQDWLTFKEPKPSAPPDIKSLLAEDETVINSHYMFQLLEYGIRMGMSLKQPMSRGELLKDAERLVQELKSLEP